MELSTVDFVLIGVYFVVLIMVGYFSSRKQKDEDYLIAERKLGTWSTMATVNASKTGSILMIFTAMVFLWGFSAVLYFIGMIIGVLVFIPFAMRLKDNSKQRFYTLADYFRYNYGKKPAVIASLLTVFMMFLGLVMNLIAGTKIFEYFTGWSFWICAVIMVLIVLTYLLMGGFKAVVKTDIIQYAALFFILVVLVIVVFSGGIIPASEWGLFSADIATMIGFFLVGLLMPFAMPELWQRVYSSKDKSSLKKGLLLSIFVYAVFSIVLVLIALTVKAKFPSIDPDLALIHGFANLLPSGLLGLSVVLLFAAIMSTIDTYIFTGASAAIQDFFKWDKKKTVKNIRKMILVFAVLGTLLSILLQSLILGSYIYIVAVAILAIPVLATWTFKKIKERTLLTGFFFGLAAAAAFIVISRGEISPLIVFVGILATIIGLLFGKLLNIFK